MRVSVFGIAVTDIPITSDSDTPQAKALNARIEAVCRYAREHVIDARSPFEPPSMFRESDERQVLELGRRDGLRVRCVYVHTMTPKGTFRQLTIEAPDARGVTPPAHCAVIAKMFGFTGELLEDYFAEPRPCGCPKPSCRDGGIGCVQAIPQEAS